VDQDALIQYVSDTFQHVDVTRPDDGPGAGDTFFIYDPVGNLPAHQQLPFATIVTKDYGDFDNASNLNRPGVFRLNVGVSRQTFDSLFEARGDDEHEFAAADRLMPHPVYARQHWVCVLNPSAATFERVKPLLAEAYAIAVNRLERQAPRESGSASP
jgi:uncharacterized protein DUF6194